MIKFIITDPATGNVLARCIADEKSYAAWQAEKVIVNDEIFDDTPEENHRVKMEVGADLRVSPVIERRRPKDVGANPRAEIVRTDLGVRPPEEKP